MSQTFMGGFDPNPAAPIAATIGGFAGWLVNPEGASDWAEQTGEGLKDWWNSETDMFSVGPSAWGQP